MQLPIEIKDEMNKDQMNKDDEMEEANLEVGAVAGVEEAAEARVGWNAGVSSNAPDNQELIFIGL